MIITVKLNSREQPMGQKEMDDFRGLVSDMLIPEFGWITGKTMTVSKVEFETQE